MFLEAIAARAATTPHHPALIQGPYALDYRELLAAIERRAAFLAARGVVPGDRVLVAAPGGAGYLLWLLAAMRARGVAVPLPDDLPAHDVRAVAQHLRARVLVGGAPALADELDRLDPWDVPASGPVPPPPGPDDIAYIRFTSGTTGRPKGATFTHRQLAAKVALMQAAVARGPGDVSMSLLRTCYDFGYATLPPLAGGATVVMPTSRRTNSIVGLIARHGVTTLYGVPHFYLDLTRAPVPAAKLRTLRRCFWNTPLSHDVVRALYARYGVLLVHEYGLGEGSRITLPLASWRDDKVGSLGTLLPGVEVRLLGEDGRAVPPGEPGELWIRSAGVMTGYYDDPEQTREVLRDGWLRTGDILRRDPEGHFWFVGRRKEMINVGGRKVYPQEVAQALLEHPEVLDAAAFGIPDETYGEVVKTVVALAPGATATPAALRAFLRSRIARYKVPRVIELRSNLPKSRAMKTETGRLR